jgi:UDP-N-acetylmuramoylalanine--D-glutamate ligase
MTIEDLRSKKVAILGLGVNNQSLTRYLLAGGVAVTIRERSTELEQKFSKEWEQFSSLITWQIGPKTLDKLEQFEVVFRSPSIPFLAPELQKAAKKGVEIYSQTKLFFDLCPAPIIGITGTNGKGTTSTLIYTLLTAGYTKGTTYLGGNIGVDPFIFLPDLTSSDLVVLELSSLQLQDLHMSPQVGVLLSLTPDHLDHHATVEEYYGAKSSLLKYQKKTDLAIVHADNPVALQIAGLSKGSIQLFSKYRPQRQSAWSDASTGEEVVFVQLGEEIDSFSIAGRKLPGEHNLENILPAVLVARHFNVPYELIQKEIVAFTGLPHRLQFILAADGVDFYDDSISTSPATCSAALKAFSGRRIHLIAGGSEKGHDFNALAVDIIERCATVSLLPGKATDKLKVALKYALAKRKDCSCLILDKAVDPLIPSILSGIQPHMQPGDVLLLSPAAASFASFSSYKERGELFTKAVMERYLKAHE